MLFFSFFLVVVILISVSCQATLVRVYAAWCEFLCVTVNPLLLAVTRPWSKDAGEGESAVFFYSKMFSYGNAVKGTL